MADELTNTDSTETVTPPEPVTAKQPTQSAGDSAGVEARIHGLTAEKNRLADKLVASEKAIEDLKAKTMSEQEKALDVARQEAAEPFKQRLADIETNLQAGLDLKLAQMTDEQKGLMPEGLAVEQAHVQADKVLAMGAGKPQATVGGPVNPQESGAKTYTREQFERWQLLAGSPAPADKAEYRALRDDMKAAYLDGRVKGFKAS